MIDIDFKFDKSTIKVQNPSQFFSFCSFWQMIERNCNEYGSLLYFCIYFKQELYIIFTETRFEN